MFIEPRDCNVSVITIVKNFIRKIILTNTSLIRSIINSIIIPSVSVSSCKTNANIITITNTRNISKAGILSLSIYRNIIFSSFSNSFYGLHTSLSFFGLRQMMLFQSSIALISPATIPYRYVVSSII